MTVEEFKNGLAELGYDIFYDEEYHRTECEKDGMFIFIDYYTLRFQWWYEENRKVGTSFYVQDFIINFKTAGDVISHVMDILKAKIG